MWSAPSPTARGGAQAHGAGQARRALTVASQRRPRTTQGDPLQGRKAALRGTRRRGRGGSGGGGGGGSSSDPRDAPDAPRHATRRGFAGPGVQQLLAPGDSDLESDDEDTPEEEAAAAAAAELSDGEVAALLGADTAAADVLAGADAGVEAELAGLLAKFEFKFDGFQVSAVRHLLCGRSVVVCAPTGAGKTAIAEAATHHFLARDRRVIYTTPLKALSNQKLGEMRARFGAAAAGLQTGDASINIEGDVVVMTTEILRNMLYRSEERGGGGDGGDDGDPQAATAGGAAGQAADRRAAAEERLAGVGLVVLDETHYLGDPGRGSVWEESIINMPKDVLILAMSATVRNPDDLAGWIGAVHGPCDAVTTSFRPVPLRWQYALSPGDGTARLLPLLGATGRALNPALLPASRRMEDAAAAAAAAEEDEWGRWDADPGGKAKGGPPPMRIRTLEELVEGMVEDGGWHRVPRWKRVPPVEATVAALAAEGMLPAIWFIFSRKECDAAAARLQGLGVQLTTPHERAAILAEVQALREDQAEAVKEAAVEALAAGLAAHHAGCLPGWKALVERLFQRGLVKVVFATETLAAGINMPARTTLLSALSRRRDGAIAALTHNELLQMAGRAGRRGFDSLGHCVVVQSRWEDAEAAWDIIRKGPEPLRSQFATSYGMVLNLLWSRSPAEAKEFLDRSFSRYLGGAGSRRVVKEAENLEARGRAILEEAGRRAGAAVARRPSGGGGGAAADSDAEGGSDGEGEGGGGGGGGERGDEAADGAFASAEQALEAILGADVGADDVWGRYQKLQGRRREEKRAARLLRGQLAEERALVADAALEEAGLPCAVGLDLSGTNIDDSSYRLPALAVARLDPRRAEGAPAAGPAAAALASGFEGGCYLCLGADNMLYLVASRNVAAVAEPGSGGGGGGGEAADAAAALQHAAALRPAAWSRLAGEVCSAEGAPSTAPALLRMPRVEALRAVDPSPEGLRALAGQRERVADVKAQLNALRGDRRFARASRRYAQAAGKAGVLLDRAAALREELQGRLDGGWRAFEDAVGVLEAAGAFEPAPPGAARGGGGGGGAGTARRRFAPLGMVAREVRGANELWLALVLTHAATQSLPAPQLAAVLSAVVAAEAFNRAGAYVAYDPSPAVAAAVEALEPARAELAALQGRARLDTPLSVDLRMAGVVEAWASGASWAEVTADCGLDDGDVARLLMRTVDVARQAAYCEHLLPPLRAEMRKAARAMDRKPISDLIT